ncbi:MAG: hypothetical protein F6K28_38790 [Microcoleus sp. SIO2G3]|nr:hypothetical protein [Microcoleus sp. SIO2G3]
MKISPTAKIPRALRLEVWTPGASSRETRPTHWLGYTNKARLRGLYRVHVGGLSLYSRDF